MKIAESAAYIEMLDAQKASYERSGFAMNDMTVELAEMMKHIKGERDDE